MKKIYLLILAIFVTKIQAQNFTNGSVYNHQVGDTIIEEYVEYLNSSNGPPRLTLRTFTNRQMSATMDTIFYTEKITANQLQWNGSGYAMSFTNTSISYYVTDLQQSVINYTFAIDSVCQVYTETTYTNSCGFLVHEKDIVVKIPPQSCFEPSFYTDTYIVPVGLYQVKACGNCLPRGLKTVNRLLYTNKGNGCGTSVVVATGLNDDQADSSTPEIYPNPSAGHYYLVCKTYDKILLINAQGRLLEQVSAHPGMNSIDLSAYPAGIYYIVMEGSALSKKIVKE